MLARTSSAVTRTAGRGSPAAPMRAVDSGTSAEVTVQTQWHPPVLTLFVPDGWTLQATATSRTALR